MIFFLQIQNIYEIWFCPKQLKWDMFGAGSVTKVIAIIHSHSVTIGLNMPISWDCDFKKSSLRVKKFVNQLLLTCGMDVVSAFIHRVC